MRPLTKKATMGRTFKYYPSSPFSPSVALGALLTRNLVVQSCMFLLISLVPSDSYAEGAKGAEAAERVLLITNSPFGPSGLLGPLTPLQALL